MNQGIWEKEHLLSLALLSCVAGESIFLLGPPGTAKSMIARRLKNAFEEKKSFEYLMSRFSTPDEIFGPVSISKLKEEDIYERNTEGFLPSAVIVFLDEIWKAGPSIQNALLTAINEKIYQNGNRVIRLPMKGLIAASNELPAEDEGLEALWDRFLVRAVSNCIDDERTFYKMLRQKPATDIDIPPSLCITDQLYDQWQARIADIPVGDPILSAITAVREKHKQAAKEENARPFDFYVSDRRWKKIVHLMQASAFLNGRTEINHSDLFLLFHTLWNRTETIPAILKIVTEALFADIEKNVASVEKELGKLPPAEPQPHWQQPNDIFRTYNYFYIKLLNFPKGTCYFYKYDYPYIHSDKDDDGVLYWDAQQCAYFIHRIDLSQPFSASQIGSDIQNVKFSRFPGGLSVDGRNYPIERNSAAPEPSEPSAPLSSSDDLQETINAVKESLALRLDSLKNPPNLFVSATDLNLAKKYVARLEKRINETEIKLISLQPHAYGK